MRLLIAIAMLLTCLGQAQASEPVALELSGVFDGKPLWARWLPKDPAFDHQRVLQVVYAPPAPAQLDHVQLSDCPFILLDAEARIVAWNGRSTASAVVSTTKGYRITRELDIPNDQQLRHDERVLTTPKTWDLRLVPLHLALVWSAKGSGTASAVDLFATKPGAPVVITWSPGRLTVGPATWRPHPDGAGHLHQLFDSEGRERLRIDTRKP